MQEILQQEEAKAILSEDILMPKCPYSECDDCLCRNTLDNQSGEKGDKCIALETTKFSENGKKANCPFYKNKAMAEETNQKSENFYKNHPTEVEKFRSVMCKIATEIQKKTDIRIKNQSKAQERRGD